MNDLQIFNFENNEVRTQLIDGEPWFIGKDVSDLLGYSNSPKALKDHVDEDDKLTERIVMSGQNRDVTIINESGLYSLIIKSKLPNAKRFKRWVTSEVLPSIRKTGSYQVPMSQEDIMIATLENQKEIKRRLATVSDDVASLKNEVDLSRLQKSKLSKLVRANAMAAVGGKKSNAYSELYRIAISEHWREIKNYFEVASYEEIPKLRFDEAMEIATMWTPSLELRMDIKYSNNHSETEV